MPHAKWCAGAARAEVSRVAVSARALEKSVLTASTRPRSNGSHAYNARLNALITQRR